MAVLETSVLESVWEKEEDIGKILLRVQINYDNGEDLDDVSRALRFSAALSILEEKMGHASIEITLKSTENVHVEDGTFVPSVKDIKISPDEKITGTSEGSASSRSSLLRRKRAVWGGYACVPARVEPKQESNAPLLPRNSQCIFLLYAKWRRRGL